MLNNIKSHIQSFRYKTAKETPTLARALKAKDFKMALYILNEKPETITKHDIESGTIYIFPYDLKEKRQFQDATAFIEAFSKTKFAWDMPPMNAIGPLSTACSRSDKQKLKTVLLLPAILKMDNRDFETNTYFHICAKNDSRRSMHDSRGCSSHRDQGYPELLEIIEHFDEKRSAYAAKVKAAKKATKTKTATKASK